MVAGILLIAAGILIAIFPQLLAWIVALVLIVVGIGFIYVSYNYKKWLKGAEKEMKYNHDIFIRF